MTTKKLEDQRKKLVLKFPDFPDPASAATPKHPGGRPPKAEPRNVTINFRLTEREAAQLRALSDLLKLDSRETILLAVAAMLEQQSKPK